MGISENFFTGTDSEIDHDSDINYNIDVDNYIYEDKHNTIYFVLLKSSM